MSQTTATFLPPTTVSSAAAVPPHGSEFSLHLQLKKKKISLLMTFSSRNATLLEDAISGFPTRSNSENFQARLPSYAGDKHVNLSRRNVREHVPRQYVIQLTLRTRDMRIYGLHE